MNWEPRLVVHRQRVDQTEVDIQGRLFQAQESYHQLKKRCGKTKSRKEKQTNKLADLFEH
jgi:hypothetical protein